MPALASFGTLLRQHVRFEERELFPAAEAQLSDDALQAVSERVPHPPRPSG